MVESNSKDPQAEQQDCAAAPGLSRDHGGAEDLNALLHSIADHFAGSGRRPPMLGEVQHLEAKAPQQGAAMIGRIEAGVAVLAEHIGEASRALPSVAASDTILPFSRPSHAPSPVTEKRSRAPLASPPPYQDLGAWAAAPCLSPVGAAEIIVADPLELAEPSMSEGGDHAWDPASTDALASTYDVGKRRGVAAEPGARAAKACEGCHGAPAEAVSAEE